MTGGAEVFVVSLCNALAKLGHQVTLLTFYQKQESEFLYNRIDKSIKIDILEKRKGIDPTLSFKLREYIKLNNFEIVHLHVQAIVYAIFPSLSYKKCKYIATIHNDAYKEAIGFHRSVRKFMFKHKLVSPVTISDESKISFEKLYGLPSDMIYNGVSIEYGQPADINLDQYRLSPKTKIFTYVASVNEVKNQLTAAKAFNKLAKEGIDAVLVIIGRLTETDYCRKVKEQASKNVIVHGVTDNPVTFLEQSDYFMLTSRYEGMPISLLEAFATRTIPVVTPVGGCKNLVHDGENGIICEDCNLESISKSISRAVNLSDQQILDMKNKLSDVFEEYSISKCAEKYLEVYNRII